MKDKICNLCKTAIDTNKEYCKFHHMEKKDIIKSKAYYHVSCFRDRLTGSKAEKDLQREALSFIRGAKKLAGIKEEVVVDLS